MTKQFVKAELIEKAEDGVFTAVASTSTIDRHGEIVSVEGWNLKNFKKNPVMLWAHDHSIPAIGTVPKIWVEGAGKKAKLMFKGKMQQATDEAKALSQLVSDGVLKTFSVGFLPTDMDGNKYTAQELLEISLVNVPANADAQITAYKSLKNKGFDDKLMKDIGINVEIVSKVVDKLISMEKNIGELNDKVESLVKAQPPAAPKVQANKVIRTRQSVVKVIAKASDKLLADEKKGSTKNERVQLAKIIKRSAEILSKSQKEQING